MKGGIGGIFRNSQGEWILGFSNASFGPSPLSMELQALKYGLQLAMENNLIQLVIETDAQTSSTFWNQHL